MRQLAADALKKTFSKYPGYTGSDIGKNGTIFALLQ
jgi:antibiotic biosynthesis monooxygenase (ABM) superfamily enzyme